MPRTTIKADAVLTLAEQTRQNLLQRFQSIDSVVTYPGIDEDFMSDENGQRDPEIREKYDLPDRYLLYVGNIEPKKNLMTLLKAYQILRSKELPHRLVIVGKRTWGQKDVWDYIHNKFLPNEIILTGYADRKDLPGIYRQAEVFVFPSLDEGFGFPALEAMRCGVPVVASPVGILKEFPLEAFSEVNPGDESDIAAQIYSMIGESSQRENQIKTAQKESQRFSWWQCAQETLKIYKQVAA